MLQRCCCVNSAACKVGGSGAAPKLREAMLRLQVAARGTVTSDILYSSLTNVLSLRSLSRFA